MISSVFKWKFIFNPFLKPILHFILHFCIQILLTQLFSCLFTHQYQILIINQNHLYFPSVLCQINPQFFLWLLVLLLFRQIVEVLFNKIASVLKDWVEIGFCAVHGKHTIWYGGRWFGTFLDLIDLREKEILSQTFDERKWIIFVFGFYFLFALKHVFELDFPDFFV